MSKRKLAFVSVALGACLCWAFATSIAGTPSQDSSQTQSAGEVDSVSLHPSTLEGYQAHLPANIARVDALDPTDYTIPFRVADPSRVHEYSNAHFEGSVEDEILRLGLPCTNIAYNNRPGSQKSYFIFGGTAPNDNCYDDCTIVPGNANKFVCAVTELFFGAASGGPPTFNVRMQVWSDCPENNGAMLYAQGDFLNIPNDFTFRPYTLTIDPPVRDPDDTFWVGGISANADASLDIARDTKDLGDEGTTGDFFAVTNGIGDCNDNLFIFGGGATRPRAGFSITMLGGSGTPGSCCDIINGMCMDNVLLSACVDIQTQDWSAANCASRECVACAIPVCTIGLAPNIENEPDCTTNYIDTTNRGCQNLTARAFTYFFTPITCAQSGCGRSGTYGFLNQFTFNGANTEQQEARRDDDHYRLDLTQDTRVTWSVKGKFPADAIISFTTQQTNTATGPIQCGTFISTAVGDNSFVSGNACNDVVATALLPGRNTAAGPFRYMLRARPSLTSLSSSALCGLPYTVNLFCETGAGHTLLTGACCVDTAAGTCIQTSQLGCLISTGFATFYQGDGTTCPSTCTGTPANDTCPNSMILTCTNCTIPYDSTYAHGEGQVLGQNQEAVGRDVWFEYTVPPAADFPGCNQARLIVSNIYACFNSRVQIMRLSNCNATQATKCLATSWVANNRISVNPMALLAGPPLVNVGPWVYARAAALATPGQCFKIRIGGQLEEDFGPAVMRCNMICTDPQAGYGWAQETGRCCFWDAANQVGSCMVTPLASSVNGPACCASLGGYLRNSTDFYDGASPPTQTLASEIQGVGCATLPCSGAGEVCYTAWDLSNASQFPSMVTGFGTVTRLVKNKLYFKYTVPNSTPLGSAIVLSGCGSSLSPTQLGVFFFDTALGVWRGFNAETGHCENLNAAAQGPGSTSACISLNWDNSEVIRGDDCNQTDPRSLGAQGLLSCYGVGEVNPCVCVQVSSTNGTGKMVPGQSYYIGMGIKNVLPDGFRPFTDPVRSDDCVNARLMQLQITNQPSCFTCTLACPGFATPEGETLPMDCSNYADHTNGGCTATAIPDILFTPVTCGATICGTSATYRFNKPCTVDADCDLGDTCNPSGFCVGPDDNSQDFDYYRIVLTQPQRLTWTVNSTFPAAVQILATDIDNTVDPAGACLSAQVVASNVNANQCTATTVSADICPAAAGSGNIYVFLLVRPTNEIGVPCGSLYYANLTCGAASTPAANCCKGDMDNNGQLNGSDIKLWITQVLPSPVGQPAIALNPALGCYDASTCRGDFSNNYRVGLEDLAGFVSALLTGTPCTNPTLCDDSAACHVLSGDDTGVVADKSTGFGGGFRAADDFKVTSLGSPLANSPQAVSKLCWYGFYFNYNTLQGCPNPLGDSADDFKITIYADSGGLPGATIANANAVSPVNLVKTNTAQFVTFANQPVARIKYTCDMPAGITVVNGNCYWLEVVNKTTGACLWHWETSKLSGNAVSVQQASNFANPGPGVGGFAPGTSNYYSYNLTTDDFAFCLPGLRISNADCGLPSALCCVYPASPPACPNPELGCPSWVATTTTSATRPVCENILNGRWFPTFNIAGPCPILPRNDDCVNAILVTSGPIYSGSTIYATTDGPGYSCEQSCGVHCNTAPDVWYKWVAVISGPATFTMCDTWVTGATLGTGGEPIDVDAFWRFDAMMVVYNNCPNGVPAGAELPGGCNDDGCTGVGASTVSRVVSSSVNAGDTYYIRIGGWQGGLGNFTFRVNQP